MSRAKKPLQFQLQFNGYCQYGWKLIFGLAAFYGFDQCDRKSKFCSHICCSQSACNSGLSKFWADVAVRLCAGSIKGGELISSAHGSVTRACLAMSI